MPESLHNGTVFTVTAPPRVQVSPLGWHELFILVNFLMARRVAWRIGLADVPAQLGSLPALPGFNLPGV